MRHDKLERELTLILLMTENKRYTVQQLCERMNISKRTLYYYLDFFRDIGFIVEKKGTVYSLDKRSPFFTKLFRKVHFTEDEAITMRRVLESSGSHSAMVAHLKRKLDSLYDLNILADEQLREQQALNLSVIYDAIKYHRNVILHHYSSPHSNSVTDRIVEPFMLMNSNNEVRCYELTSGMNKTFKLSRMERVELLADEWQHEAQLHTIATDILLVDELASLVEAERHDGSDEVGSSDDAGLDIGFLNMVNQCRVGQSGRIVHLFHPTLLVVAHIRYVGNGGDDIHVELSVETLLHNLHVEQSEESTAEAEAQGNGGLGGKGQRGIVELQFLQ